MDLVRDILLALEEHEHGSAPQQLQIAGYSEKQIGYHVWLMGQAGFLQVADVTACGDPSPVAGPLAMTWEGHEFLAAAHEASAWTRAMEKVTGTGAALSFEVLKATLVGIAKQKLGLG
jgi:hypothetical protein